MPYVITTTTPRATARNANGHQLERLECLRAVLRAERISWDELAELQSLSDYIAADDMELREAAGVPEFDSETTHAVATHMDAQRNIDLLIEDHGGSIDEFTDVSEDGGTVGPLPDGTIIDVRHVDWIAMRTLAGRLPVRTHTKPEVLDIYNSMED